MRKIFKYLPMAICILVTYLVAYVMTQLKINSIINLAVMIFLIIITDEIFLTKFKEKSTKVICKSFIWVVIISLGIFFFYNCVINAGSNKDMLMVSMMAVIFIDIGCIIGYLIIYEIAHLIKIIINKLLYR